jgi:hypothetical protein
MKRLKGIYQNCDPVDQPQEYYRDAKNILVDDKIGSILSETITENTQEITALVGKTVLDVALFNSVNDNVIFYTDGVDLLIYDNGQSYNVYSLNLTQEVVEGPPALPGDPIQGGGTFLDLSSLSIQSDVFVNRFGEQIIVFVTSNGPAYTYNRTNKKVETLFPSVSQLPIIYNARVNETGGSLKAGAYYIAVAYKHNDGTITNFYDVKGPFYVSQQSYASPTFSGSLDGTLTSNSITFDLINSDQSYESHIIGVIPVYGGVIGEVQILPELSIKATSYTYSGSEAYTPGSLAEIQIDKAFYDNPQTVHVQEDITYLGNLSKPDYNDIQAYVNQISVRPVYKQFDNLYYEERSFSDSGSIKIEPFNGFKDPNIARQYAGYKRGEVYAIYISFLLENGGETPAFHIPGRVAINNEADYVSGTNAQSTFDISPVVVTTSVQTIIEFTYNLKEVAIPITGTTSIAYTIQLAINEAYRNGQFDARVTGVSPGEFTVVSRFPGSSGVLPFAWNVSNIPNLTINGSTNGSLSLSYSSVSGYMIESIGSTSTSMGFWRNISEYYPSDFPVYADQNVRHHHFPEASQIPLSVDNKLQVLGFKLENFPASFPPSIDGKVKGYKVYYAKRTDSNRRALDQTVLIKAKTKNNKLVPNRRHPDTDYNNSPLYAESTNVYYCHPFEMMTEKKNSGSITHVKQIRQGTLATSTESNYSGQCNLLTAQHNHTSDVSQGLRVSNVTGSAYVDSTISDSNTSLSFAGINWEINNKFGESKLVVQTTVDLHQTVEQNTFLTDLFSVKSNVYQSYDSQELVSTGYVHTNLNDLNSGQIFGGDTFLCNYVWKAYNTENNEVCVHSALVESSYNIGYRSIGLNPWESFFPVLDQGDFGAPLYGDGSFSEISSGKTIFNDNYFSYNKSYSYPNQFKFPTIQSKFNQSPSSYPTRVIRSSDKYTRTFLQDDYIDLPTKRGELIKLDSFNNTLIAHLEKALIRTKGRETIVAGDVNAFVGSGDIFAVRPEEIIYTADGFGGIQKKEHSIATTYGYFFFDQDARKLYVLESSGIKDITDTIYPIVQEVSGDIIWGQDPKFGRVFFKYGSNVLSYSSKVQNWVSRHQWFGNQSLLIFANNREHGYLVNNATFYEIDNHTVSFVTPAMEYVFVENQEAGNEKEFMSLIVQGSKNNTGYPFNKIKIETELQSEQHEIVDFNLANPYLVSARKVLNMWSVNNLRDNDNKRFRGNYFIVSLIDDSNDSLKKIRISDINVNYKKPIR